MKSYKHSIHSIPGPYLYWFHEDGSLTITLNDGDPPHTKSIPGKMKKFTKQERSTWPYFWAHWFAFQMVAINLRVWRLKYLFHDWYKPWLKMFGVPYKKIQKFHRYHSTHHIEYFENPRNIPTEFDWDSLIIDWECSQYTKEACPRNALQEMEYVIQTSQDDYLKYVLNRYMRPRLEKLGL